MHISEALSGILIKAAFSADTKSKQKERLSHLFKRNLITKEQLEYCLARSVLNEQ